MLIAWYVIFFGFAAFLEEKGHADVCSLLGVTRNDMANQELQVSQHVKDETQEEGNHTYLPRSFFTFIGYRSTACSHQLGSKAQNSHMDTPHHQLFRPVEYCTVG
jgi:hypothetical protein